MLDAVAALPLRAERLGRGGSHRLGEARVERPLGRLEARTRPGELPLELEDALAAYATLDERRAQEEDDAAGADEETGEQGHDRHEGTGP